MNYAWEQLTAGAFRCRLPFLDVTVGLAVGDGESLVIDCGTTLSEAGKIAADVCELTGTSATRLLMTHHHIDHILGCGGFGGIESYAAPPVAFALTGGLPDVCAEAIRYGADAGEVDRAACSARPPDHRVWHADIDLGDRVVRIEHPGRGHTDHDLIAVVPGDPAVVFCGDLVEESADPAIGPDADLAAWPATLDRMLQLGGEGAIYVPGHGAVTDAAFVRAQRDWLASRA
jgi:glyoxylase-like metal-dependent hydrolase (beta-lactamase superfamily II)